MGARIKNGLGGLLPTTATGLAYFWAWDQKPRTARCRMRNRRVAARRSRHGCLALMADMPITNERQGQLQKHLIENLAMMSSGLQP